MQSGHFLTKPSSFCMFFELFFDLYYYTARFYSPKLGRFLQTDPAVYEDQLNMHETEPSHPFFKKSLVSRLGKALRAPENCDEFGTTQPLPTKKSIQSKRRKSLRVCRTAVADLAR